MDTKLYSDQEISSLRAIPKRINNPMARWLEKPKQRPVHRQRNFEASGDEDEEMRFSIFQRQNLRDDSDFSSGILYLPPGGSPLTLARYNGPSHVHGDIVYRPHIHSASAQAIEAGRKPEFEAEESNRFLTVDDALACLLEDFNVSGLNLQRDRQLRIDL